MADSVRYAGRCWDGRCLEVRVKNGTIDEVNEVPEDASLPWLLPPLVDVQHNGALGVFLHRLAELGPEPLHHIARLQRRHGVGRCWLTTVSNPVTVLERMYEVIRDELAADRSLDTLYPGMFHEGIFMSPEDGWRGAHPRKYISPPDYALFERFDKASGGRIRLVNVAPEQPGGLDFIEQAVAAGKQVTLGHCCPDSETIGKAIDRGARWVTHFGNGAAPQMHRFLNPFWSYLSRQELSLMVICDGVHVPPEVMRTAFLTKSPDQIVPVSDASGFSGYPPGRYEGNDQAFEVSADGKLQLADSELLMGAWFQQDRCVEVLVDQLGMTLPEAWRQCSEVPAAAFGIDLPELVPGAEASFVLAHWDDGLVLDQSVQLGEPYLETPIRPTDASHDKLYGPGASR